MTNPARTAHGVPLPDNHNRLGRPPRTLDLNDPAIRDLLEDPNIVNRLRALSPAEFNEVTTDLLQHRRAIAGERALPGQYMGDDSLPHQPMPFAPRYTYRPDREPGSAAHDLYRGAVERIEATLMTDTLAARMRSHDADSPDSTWNRVAPRDDAQPSLRESIAGAVGALGG